MAVRNYKLIFPLFNGSSPSGSLGGEFKEEVSSLFQSMPYYRTDIHAFCLDIEATSDCSGTLYVRLQMGDRVARLPGDISIIHICYGENKPFLKGFDEVAVCVKDMASALAFLFSLANELEALERVDFIPRPFSLSVDGEEELSKALAQLNERCEQRCGLTIQILQTDEGQLSYRLHIRQVQQFGRGQPLLTIETTDLNLACGKYAQDDSEGLDTILHVANRHSWAVISHLAVVYRQAPIDSVNFFFGEFPDSYDSLSISVGGESSI